MDIAVRRKLDAVRQHRLQHRFFRLGFVADALTGEGAVQPRYGTDRPRRCFLYHRIARTGINADLVCLFFAEHLLYLQHAARDFQMRQTVSCRVP